MAKSTVKYGSAGDEVKELQKLLNTNGYSLSEDGVFGKNTQNAVYDYQRKNGLSVDGIVGTNTWSKLSGSQAPAAPAVTSAVTSQAESKATYTPAGTRPAYTESEKVKNAESAVDNWEQNKPSQYTGTYQSQIDSLLEKVMNGERFKYDMNADALYQQYREQYVNNGKKAMEDTAAKSAEYTGGYGSSYGTTAAQQAYQSYLQGLNDKVPELEERAYNRYKDNADAEKDRLSLLKALDESEYDRYGDLLDAYYKDGSYLQKKLENMSESEYKKFLDDVSAWEKDRSFDYNAYTDALAQENYEKKLAYQKERDAASDAQWQKEYDLKSYSAHSRSSSSSKASSGGTSASDDTGRGDVVKELVEAGLMDYPKTYEAFVDMTGYPGVMTEHEFILRSSGGSYEKYLKKMFIKYT